MEIKNDVLVEVPVDNGVIITTSKGPIVVEKVYEAKFQKEKTLTAQLRQIVTSKFSYPERQISNDMQDSLFDLADFGFERKDINNEEHRVAFVDVPDTYSIDMVEAMLKKFPNAVLYKVLANEPILTDAQKRGIAAKLTTKDIIANSQVIRYGKDAKDKAGVPVGGQLILKDGRIQYREIFFKREAIADIDARTIDGEVYYTPELRKELFGATEMADQHI